MRTRLRIFAVVGVVIVGSLATAAVATSTRTSAKRNGLIAFMRPGKLGEYDIWVTRSNGTGLRRVTTSPRDRSDYNPDWSPDGSTILFERRFLDGGTDGDDLYVVGATGGKPKQLTNCVGGCGANGLSTAAVGPRFRYRQLEPGRHAHPPEASPEGARRPWQMWLRPAKVSR